MEYEADLVQPHGWAEGLKGWWERLHPLAPFVRPVAAEAITAIETVLGCLWRGLQWEEREEWETAIHCTLVSLAFHLALPITKLYAAWAGLMLIMSTQAGKSLVTNVKQKMYSGMSKWL